MSEMKYNDPLNRSIIGGVRCCGKSTELIKIAAKYKCLIVCSNREKAKCVIWQAQEMGLFIEPPQDIRTIISKPELLRDRDVTILIDDVEDVLETLLKKKVAVMTTSATIEPMECLKKGGAGKEIIERHDRELEYWKWAAREARSYAASLERIVREGGHG